MLVYWFASLVVMVFRWITAGVRAIFPAFWSAFTEGFTTLVGSPGGSFALGLLDRAVGLAFVLTMTSTVISVYLTVRLCRYIAGVVTKA